MRKQKKNYSNYLMSRSWTGIFYRYFFIYPFFLKYLGNNSLDYGCGIGDFLLFAKLFNKNTEGTDINDYNVKICKQRKLIANVLDNKFVTKNKKNPYDSIILDNVIEHIKDPTNTIKYLNILLKHHGFLLIGIPVGEAGYKADPDHKIYYSEDSLDKLFKKNGFKKINVFYRPFKNNFLRKHLRQFCYYSVYQKI